MLYTQSIPPRTKHPHANIRSYPSASEVPARNSGPRITFRVVGGLSHGLIVGADYLRNRESIIDFGHGKGFKHSQNAPWTPFLDHTSPPLLTASLIDSRTPIVLDSSDRTHQSHENMPREDNSTLEWDVYLSKGDISTDGYVSKAVGEYAVGPMRQVKQLAIILPKEAYDLGKTAVVVGDV